MSLEATFRRLDQARSNLSKLKVSRQAIVDYSRGLISREQAEADLLAGGWHPDNVRKLLAAAERNLKFPSVRA